MVDAESATHPGKVGKVIGWATTAIGLLIALATFDPHLTNLELYSYLLRAFLPELLVVLVAGILVAAWRFQIIVLLWRHKIASLIILWLFWSLMSTQIQSALKNPNIGSPLLVYNGEWSNFRVVFGKWRRLLKSRYSRQQATYFRIDMETRASDAYSKIDLPGARAYLTAAQDGAGGYGEGSDTAGQGLSYLASRDRYVQNHVARLRNLEQVIPLSPLALYLSSALFVLSEDDESFDQWTAYVRRVRAARDSAKEIVTGCMQNATLGTANDDAAAFISRVAEASGDGTAFRKGEQPAGWCARITPMIVAGSSEPAQSPKNTFTKRFIDISQAAWGPLADPKHNEPVTTTASQSVESMNPE